jgi:hypothetical protein
MVFPQTILSPKEHPDGCMDAARNKLDWFEFVTTALDRRSRKYFFNIILGMILMWTADRFQLAPASDVGQDWLELTGASARGNAAGAGPPNDRRSRPLPAMGSTGSVHSPGFAEIQATSTNATPAVGCFGSSVEGQFCGTCGGLEYC